MSRKQAVVVANAFTPPHEGYRSVNLKLDYADLGVVGAYLPTHKSVGVIEAIFASLQTDSRERANTLIAPYGSGKSSLLLFLCMLLEAREESREQLLEVNDKIRRLAPNAAQAIAQHLADAQGYLVVMLTGDEGPLEAAFCTGLQHALEQRGLKKTWEQLLPARKKRTKAANKVEDSLSAVSPVRYYECSSVRCSIGLVPLAG